MYRLTKSNGVDAAIEWFNENGKPATWGGTHSVVADQLIEDGMVEAGLRLMEFDIESSPGKVWLLRKAAQAFLANGHPEKALQMAKKGLSKKSEDERLQTLVLEAERELGE